MRDTTSRKIDTNMPQMAGMVKPKNPARIDPMATHDSRQTATMKRAV
jgi:hypothetical protein